MALEIIREDIKRLWVDAVVNPTDKYLSGGGGLDRQIRKAAGYELDYACRKSIEEKGFLMPGEVRVTKGFKLKAKLIFHTAGPVWKGGDSGEEVLLAECYRNALTEAAELGLVSIAFPLIGSGHFHCPSDTVFDIAAREIRAFLGEHDMQVYLVLFDDKSFDYGKSMEEQIRSYIDRHYVDDTLGKSRARFEGGRVRGRSSKGVCFDMAGFPDEAGFRERRMRELAEREEAFRRKAEEARGKQESAALEEADKEEEERKKQESAALEEAERRRKKEEERERRFRESTDFSKDVRFCSTIPKGLPSKGLNDGSAEPEDDFCLEFEEKADESIELNGSAECSKDAMAPEADGEPEWMNEFPWEAKGKPTSEAIEKYLDRLHEGEVPMEESFQHMLLRLVDEKGMTDAQCYNAANVDRRLFSRIRSNPDYHPSKITVLQFAFALKLDIDETESLLKSAEYAFSNSNKLDLALQFFIKESHEYDIDRINMYLFKAKLPELITR